jgi:hypothetical protein
LVWNHIGGRFAAGTAEHSQPIFLDSLVA